MSATVINDAAAAAIVMPPSTADTHAALAAATDVEFATCECCGLREECTLAYIERIRERFQGKWICGLCSEAVKDEMVRSERLISTEEAMNRHGSFCSKFRSPGPPPDPTRHLIAALRQLLRKGLESPKSMPCSPTRNGRLDGGQPLTRSESCMPSLNLADSVADFDDVGVQLDPN